MASTATITGKAQLVKELASRAGFDLAGIAAVPQSGLPELDYFARWIDAGRGGEMRYLEARNDAGELKRAALRNAFPWAKSVIVCAMNYNSSAPYSVSFGASEAEDATRGWISRYAWFENGNQRDGGGTDYHDILLKRLQEVERGLADAAGEAGNSAGGFQSRIYVDTGPLVERVYAKYAGVGWMGKNTCMIHPELGSWLFLGVIVTSLPLAPDLPAEDRCGSCTRCIDACPTSAIVAPYELDASRCISYLTIEKRGDIPEDLRAGMGRQVFGCDVCQDVCPWNMKPGNAPASTSPEFTPRPELVNPALEWLEEVTRSDERFREDFRGSPVKRAKRSGMRRNVAIAMGNSGDAKFRPALEGMQMEQDPVVAEHATWALRRLPK